MKIPAVRVLLGLSVLINLHFTKAASPQSQRTSVPTITSTGLGCSDLSCVWVKGSNFTSSCLVTLYTPTHQSLGAGLGPTCTDASVTFRIPTAIQIHYPSIQFTVTNNYGQWSSPYLISIALPTSLTMIVQSDSASTQKIYPVLNSVNIWDLTEVAAWKKPSPMITEAILMTATGGRKWSTMYKKFISGAVDPFKPLTDAIDLLIAAGVKPLIVIGNVDNDLSNWPDVRGRDDSGGYDTNVGKPTDFAKYRSYLTALFTTLINKYGETTVRKWGFRLMTEPNNGEWWIPCDPQPGDIDPNNLIHWANISSKCSDNEMLKNYELLYDQTLMAMGAAMSRPVLDIGNLANISQTSWLQSLAKWFSTSDNTALSRRSNRVSFSYYGSLAANSNPGYSPSQIVGVVNLIKSKLSNSDLRTAKLSVAEGGIIYDENNHANAPPVPDPLYATWWAATIKYSLDAGLDSFTRWDTGPATGPNRQEQVVKMYDKMSTWDRVSLSLTGASSDSSATVDGIAARDSQGSLGVILFNYIPVPSRVPTTIASISLRVSGLEAGHTYKVTQYDYSSDAPTLVESMQTDKSGVLSDDLRIPPNTVFFLRFSK